MASSQPPSEPKPPKPSVPPPSEEGKEEQDRLDMPGLLLDNAPPWLVSALVHMLGLIVLSLLLLPRLSSEEIALVVSPVWAEKLGEQLEWDTLMGDEADPAEEPIVTPTDLPEVPDPIAVPLPLDVTDPGAALSTDLKSPQIGLALLGRQEGMKKSLLAGYGGTAETQAAVELGLEWLARQQQKDGSWSLVGPYANGATDENRVAATAMALLAFQGNGNTHRGGRFQTNVSRGWNWLYKKQDADGNFYSEGPNYHRFYTNGQCAIAICELYAMTQDKQFREPAERVIAFLLKSQSPLGGWRYSPASDSDVSVTGWIVMALQSARMGGLKVPDDNLKRIERFLDGVALSGGSRYPYQRGEEPRLAMTAEALLCRQYLGWQRSDRRLIEGLDWITKEENLVDYERNRDVYYWYYAAQACHHMEGQHWKRWNERMRQAVPEHQVRTGKEAGSWDPMKPTMDEWGPNGGRLYVTCLSIYLLEVYYRHLPLYASPFVNPPAAQEE